MHISHLAQQLQRAEFPLYSFQGMQSSQTQPHVLRKLVLLSPSSISFQVVRGTAWVVWWHLMVACSRAMLAPTATTNLRHEP